MNPSLPSIHETEIIHPSLKVGFLRQRGSYWWPQYQVLLEEEAKEGKRTLVHGTFYVFLEDTKNQSRTPYVIRYGNVFMTDHWITRTVAVPQDHPDGDVAPYKAERIVEEWREEMRNRFQNPTK